MILNVITVSLRNDPAGQSSAENWRDQLQLDFIVLGDQDGAWAADWAGNDAAPHHSYTMIGSDGRITWRQDDGSSTTADALSEAALDAE
ncbi:MAG: hypothetical protein AAFV53_02130 [Myxococcota bacterium]